MENTNKIIVFSDEDDTAYGSIKSFKNIEEFKSEIENYLDCKVKLTNIRMEKCITTSQGIEADMLIPLSLTDAIIDDYYIADIEKL